MNNKVFRAIMLGVCGVGFTISLIGILFLDFNVVRSILNMIVFIICFSLNLSSNE